MSKKLLVAGVIMSLVAVVLVGVGASTASAQSMSLCQTVDALVLAGVIAPDKVAAAKAAAGCSAAAAPAASFNRDLTVGSTGADVTALQTMLGVTPATGYFGAITKAAVVAYQTSKGISATGYVGPLTRAALNYVAPVVTPSTGGSTGSTGSSASLDGTDGTISDVNELTQYNNEEVGEGDEDVKVLGMEIEASNEGDIQLKSMKIELTETGSGDSEKLDDYVSDVSIWMGSTKIGSADADQFNEDDDGLYSKTISLSNAVIKADETVKFYVAVSAVNSFDSGDIDGNDWSVDVLNIRYTDGSGVTSTESDAGDLTGDLDVAMDFVSFGDAADTEITISTASDTPDADIVVVDDTEETEDVLLLKGKIKVEGSSDVVLDEMPITFTVAGTATGLASTTGSVKLVIDGEEYTESVGSTFNSLVSSVTFDDMELDIEGESTVEFAVYADILGIDDALTAGDTLKAEVTASNRSMMDIEDEEGDSVTDRSGVATGEAQEFRENGISISLVSVTASGLDNGTANDDLGSFVIKFKVTAIGETVYISSLADAQLSGNTDGKTTVHASRAGTATVGGVTASIDNLTDSDKNAAGLWAIEEGSSNAETFELTTTIQLPTAGAAGLYKVQLGGVRWTTDGTDATPSNSYTSNLDTLKVSGTLN
jgi:hypothetical protein